MSCVALQCSNMFLLSNCNNPCIYSSLSESPFPLITSDGTTIATARFNVNGATVAMPKGRHVFLQIFTNTS